MVTRFAWMAARFVSSNYSPIASAAIVRLGLRRVGWTYERYEVCLGRLLERHDRRRLEPEVGLEVLRDLADQSLEGEFSDQQFRRSAR